jgi:hypothetical protein
MCVVVCAALLHIVLGKPWVQILARADRMKFLSLFVVFSDPPGKFRIVPRLGHNCSSHMLSNSRLEIVQLNNNLAYAHSDFSLMRSFLHSVFVWICDVHANTWVALVAAHCEQVSFCLVRLVAPELGCQHSRSHAIKFEHLHQKKWSTAIEFLYSPICAYYTQRESHIQKEGRWLLFVFLSYVSSFYFKTFFYWATHIIKFP